MEEADKDWMMIRMVGGWVFLLVLARPGSPGQRVVERLLLLFLWNRCHFMPAKCYLLWCQFAFIVKCLLNWNSTHFSVQHTHHTVLRPFFRDHPGEPVPEENSWTLWCKERLTEADTETIRLGATPSGLTSAHLHHSPIFYRPDALPATQPSVKALTATSD